MIKHRRSSINFLGLNKPIDEEKVECAIDENIVECEHEMDDQDSIYRCSCSCIFDKMMSGLELQLSLKSKKIIWYRKLKSNAKSLKKVFL